MISLSPHGSVVRNGDRSYRQLRPGRERGRMVVFAPEMKPMAPAEDNRGKALLGANNYHMEIRYVN